MLYIALACPGLRKPRERVKFDQPYLSEKVTYSFFNAFAGYERNLLYIFTDFQVSEGLH